MQVDADAVWVATGGGVFRFAKATSEWTRVKPPASVPFWGATATVRVKRDGKKTWFFGADTAIEWEE
jgi:hypothetical protein